MTTQRLSRITRDVVATSGTALMSRTASFRVLPLTTALAAGALAVAACSGSPTPREGAASGANPPPLRTAGMAIVVKDTVLDTTIEASGVAEPVQQATLSTKLMGTVTAVLVHEGDAVRAEQALLRIDARDLLARGSQVAATIGGAEAMQQEAAAQATRFRALYTDSAATRAQLDAAEAALSRANAGVSAARAASSELDAMSSYATVRAPFTGIVARRLADPGMFAAPGAPLLTVQDVSSLRISASVSADVVRQLKRGQHLPATIDGAAVSAIVEGIVPANAGNLFTINATVDNRLGRHRAGSAAVLSIATGTQRALVVPVAAIVRDGDLTGVVVRGVSGDERRWVRLGITSGSLVEVTSGLHAGEAIIVPAKPGT